MGHPSAPSSMPTWLVNALHVPHRMWRISPSSARPLAALLPSVLPSLMLPLCLVSGWRRKKEEEEGEGEGEGRGGGEVVVVVVVEDGGGEVRGGGGGDLLYASLLEGKIYC